ncbi:hypothetical protein YC2023_030078 [Brassica napus]
METPLYEAHIPFISSLSSLSIPFVSSPEKLINKDGAENGEGRDGVQGGPRNLADDDNPDALLQQLRRHRESINQQHVPEMFQRLRRRYRSKSDREKISQIRQSPVNASQSRDPSQGDRSG